MVAVVGVFGSVRQLAEGVVGSVSAVTGAAISLYRK